MSLAIHFACPVISDWQNVNWRDFKCVFTVYYVYPIMETDEIWISSVNQYSWFAIGSKSFIIILNLNGFYNSVLLKFFDQEV